jgi:arylsulfatase A-like enzyme
MAKPLKRPFKRKYLPNRWAVAAPAALLAAAGMCALAQTVGPGDSLNATRSPATSDVIPAAQPTFGGAIQKNAGDSTPWWPPKVVAPPNAPNVFVVLLDDAGFAATSTFGGPIPTPVLDELADEGLRYTNFHVTAMCSPTRAAFLTGRNHHSVGNGIVSDLATGFPGYDAVLGKENAPFARVLQANGYVTAWFGKNHNTPPWDVTDAGPFDEWPNGMGFDYFYGFMGGETNMWAPSVYENTTLLFPSVGHPKYNFNIDMADKTIGWIKRVDAVAPDRPMFVYYAPGATHGPHQPTAPWIAKFKGKFDAGWNVYREQAFERQKRLGVIPKDAKLTPWPDSLPKWSTLSPDQKRLYAREMEVYAAFMAETDYEIGRVIQAFKDTHRYNNTLTVYITGDNGASAEGGMNGASNEFAAMNGLQSDVKTLLKHYDEWGGPDTAPHFATPWAWAIDTPFKWTKQVASFFGGTRQGVVVVWPDRIKDSGGIRNQFTHIIDVSPTILEAAGISQPTVVDGVKQRPIEGTSFAYTFDKANADAPSRHTTQYFEMVGVPGMYQDGWMASVVPVCPPWDPFCKNPNALKPWDGAKWELYNVAKDWTQNDNVASQYPDKLQAMQQLFVSEANKYNVFPLNADKPAMAFAQRPGLKAGQTRFTYSTAILNLPPVLAPNLLNTSYSISARVTVPANAEGVIVTQGGHFGGYALAVKDGHPFFVYNLLALSISKWESPKALPAGRHDIVFTFKGDGGIGKGGVGTLLVDGATVEQHRMERSIPALVPVDEGFSIAKSNVTAVSHDYHTPFDFDGDIDSVVINRIPAKLTDAQRQLLEDDLGEAWSVLD